MLNERKKHLVFNAQPTFVQTKKKQTKKSEFFFFLNRDIFTLHLMQYVGLRSMIMICMEHATFVNLQRENIFNDNGLCFTQIWI